MVVLGRGALTNCELAFRCGQGAATHAVFPVESPNELLAMRAVLNFLRCEDGPTAVEYAVLLAMIVLACVGAVNTMANATASSFDDSATQLNGVLGS